MASVVKIPALKTPSPADMRARLFVLEYLSDEKLNATRAAIRAGFSENSATEQASRLLRTDKVQRMIDEIIVDRETRLKMKCDQVLIRLNEIREAKITDYLHFGHDVIEEEVVIDEFFDTETLEASKVVKDSVRHHRADVALVITHRNKILFNNSEDLTDAQARVIQEVSVGRNGEMKLKLRDSVQANKMIGDHLGMFKRGDDDPDTAFKTSFQRMLDEIRDNSKGLPFKTDE